MSRSAPTHTPGGASLARTLRVTTTVASGALNGSAAAVTSDVAIGDWEDLLSAVKSRLRLTVGELLAVLPPHQLPDAAHRVQSSVLECVNALDQLHLTLTHELARREQLEREVIETQNVLAQARNQLSATGPKSSVRGTGPRTTA
jgi:C4-dicarboxylate-specific signal transduction histidine kinase